MPLTFTSRISMPQSVPRMFLPFLLESRLTLLGLTAGWSSVSVDILRLQLARLRSAPLGSAGLRGSSSQRRCRLSVCGRRVGAWRRQVCVGTQAHGRGMGFSPDTTSHTHPQRAAEREREREVCFSRGCLLLAGETLQEFSDGMRMSLFLIGALSGCCPW